MSIDVQKKQGQVDTSEEKTTATQQAQHGGVQQRLVAGLKNIDLRQVHWRETLLTAVVMAIGWSALFLADGWVQFLAGIVPVSAGLYLGRRIHNQIMLHGIVLGMSGFLFGLLMAVIYAAIGGAGIVPLPSMVIPPEETPQVLTPSGIILFYIQFSLFAMIPFPAFGTVIAHRNEQRRREMEAQVAVRGGQLERAGAVRTLEDLRGLSLPQFGTYIRQLFSKHGFTFKDYQFLDKDKHLDIEMEYANTTYLLRLSVSDKIRPGTIETLSQDMRKKSVPKGLVITSTEFTPDATKSAKGKRNIVLIDGQTLFDIAEK